MTFVHNVSRTIRGVRPATLRRLPLAILLGAALTGCAVMPEPIDAGTRNARAKSDVDTLFKDVDPAYRHGESMAGNPGYKDKPWEAAEPDLRSSWESNHPQSSWDKFKDAVREGWERVTK